MKGNFERALPFILKHEGGKVNHPKDPGGKTNQGVTQRTYDAYKKRIGTPASDVYQMLDSERDDIYKFQYWDKIHGDELPSGLAYAVFDFAVNSGPGRAAKFLQKIVGAAVDGVIGENTIAAVWNFDSKLLVEKLCDDRLRWLKTLRTFSTFGRGWTRRVNEVKSVGMSWAVNGKPKELDIKPTEGKADGDQKETEILKQVLGNKEALGTGGAVVTSILSASSTNPIIWVVAGIVAVGAGIGIYLLARKMLKEDPELASIGT